MKSFLAKLSIAIAIVFGLTSVCLTPAFADSSNTKTPEKDAACSYDIPDELKAALGCEKTSTLSTAGEVALRIANTVIAVLGIIAVIFVIKGGIDYMTSLGDSNKLKRAKDTIVYAVIGLVICALSFSIINFVVVGVLTGYTNRIQSYDPTTNNEGTKITSQEGCEAMVESFKEQAKNLNKNVNIVSAEFVDGKCHIKYQEI